MHSWETFTLEQFHFLRPHFLWALIPVVVLLLLQIAALNEVIKWRRFIPKHLRPFMIQKGNHTVSFVWSLALLSALAIAVIGLSGPAWEKIELPGKTLESPMVLVLDMSQSMMATDIQPNRLERAKFKIDDLLAAKPGARVALVGFAGSAHVIIPLTDDYDLVKSHSNELTPNIMPLSGTDLFSGLQLAKDICSNIAAPATFVVMTDAVDSTAFDALQRITTGENIHVKFMPFNTTFGATIPSRNPKRPMRDGKGREVHSSLDLEVLQQINSLEQVEVQELTLDASDVESIAEYVQTHLKFTDESEEKEDDWQDKGLYCMLPLLFLVLMYFRKGMAIFTVALLTSCSADFEPADLFLTKDYQGQLQYDKLNFSKAADLYESPLHKGVSYYKDEAYKEAIFYFEKDTTAKGKYNLGLAYYKVGDYAAAALAFEKAIALDPNFEPAKNNRTQIQKLVAGQNEVSLKDAEEAAKNGPAENKQNDSPEDLSGGGDEATEEQMQKERMEETTNTDIRKGKELEELPDDFELGKDEGGPKVMMQKVDDDPSLFLKRKFLHQVKTNKIERNPALDKW